MEGCICLGDYGCLTLSVPARPWRVCLSLAYHSRRRWRACMHAHPSIYPHRSSSDGSYFATLSRLLQLAPRNRTQTPPLSPRALSFSSPRAQSILITHYVDNNMSDSQTTDHHHHPPASKETPADISTDNHNLEHPKQQHNNNNNNNSDPSLPVKKRSLGWADSVRNLKQQKEERDSDTPVNGCPSWTLEEDTNDDNDNDDYAKLQSPHAPHHPWPMGHQQFLRNDDDNQSSDFLCLEIASGAAPWHAAQWIRDTSTTMTTNKTTKDVLLPGSLRERGEFSLVELGLVEEQSRKGVRRSFGWKVVNVEFHQLNDFPE